MCLRFRFHLILWSRTAYIKPEPLNNEDAENDDANDDEFGDVE
jgi:hypothetical protein